MPSRTKRGMPSCASAQRAHAFVAARAGLEIDEQHALAVDQARSPSRTAAAARAADCRPPGRDCFSRATIVSHSRASTSGPRQQLLQVVARDLHQLDVLERRQRERPRLVQQQRRLARPSRPCAGRWRDTAPPPAARRPSRSRRAPGRTRRTASPCSAIGLPGLNVDQLGTADQRSR